MTGGALRKQAEQIVIKQASKKHFSMTPVSIFASRFLLRIPSLTSLDDGLTINCKFKYYPLSQVDYRHDV